MVTRGVGRPARSSFRKPGLFRPNFQKPELPRPGLAEGKAALAAPLRILEPLVSLHRIAYVFLRDSLNKYLAGGNEQRYPEVPMTPAAPPEG